MTTFEAVELEALRRMSVAEKFAAMNGLWQTAWELTTAGVRARHPGWREEEVTAEVRKLFARDSA